MQLCHVMERGKDGALLARMVWQLYLQSTQMIIQRLCHHVYIASNHCDACSKSKQRMYDDQFATWYERHKPACSAYHDGRAGQMELHGILHAVRGSEE